MSAVAARGDADELSRFRRLVTFTIVATFVLILIGGVVRVSDSGLGCGAEGSGTHGWPLCEGGVLPADSAESVIEFTPPGRRDGGRGPDRAAGLARRSGACAATACSSAARSPQGSWSLAQAALGGLTVEKGLEDELVAAHLGLAMLLLGLLFLLRRGAETTATRRRRSRCAACAR